MRDSPSRTRFLARTDSDKPGARNEQIAFGVVDGMNDLRLTDKHYDSMRLLCREPRRTGSAHSAMCRSWLASRFEELGFGVAFHSSKIIGWENVSPLRFKVLSPE